MSLLPDLKQETLAIVGYALSRDDFRGKSRLAGLLGRPNKLG